MPTPPSIPKRPSYSLFTHGVGTQSAGYSAKAQRRLAAALDRRGYVSYGQEVLWAPVLDAPEAAMLRSVAHGGSKNRPLQRLVVETLADALCFRNRLEDIFTTFDVAYARLRAPAGISIFAHSLGVVLALEWLRARPSVRVDRFVSFGVNLQLFHLGATGAFVIPASVAEKPGTWISYFDDTDMLGYPLRGWIPSVIDIEVDVGGWFTRWNGLSHLGYWTDKDFWTDVIPTRF